MSGLLLDTHTLLWWLVDDPGLSQEARQAIASADNVVVVSAATAWEIAVKRALGKIDAPQGLAEAVAACGFEPLSVSIAHAEAAGALPRLHDDPFDRMLVAQARLEGLTLVTRDEIIPRYAVAVLRA